MNPRTNRIRLGMLAMALGLLTWLPGSARANETAQQVMAKADAKIRNAKTYQAELLIKVTKGPFGNQKQKAMEVTIDSVRGQKMAVKMTPAFVPENLAAPDYKFATVQMLDDGAKSITYFPETKKYREGPSKQVNSLMQLLRQLVNADTADLTFEFITKDLYVNTVPCYAIRAIPNRPIEGFQNASVSFVVTKSSYQISGASLVGQMVENGGLTDIKMTINVVSLQLNTPIPDSAFQFTLPSGATKGDGDSTAASLLNLIR